VEQAAQTVLVVGPQAAARYWPAPHTAHVAHTVSVVAPHAASRYWPAPQVEQALHAVSWVGVQALAWNCPGAQAVQATHALPARWNPCAQVVQVVAPVQAAHPAGQVAQVMFAVAVQAAV
jgi:hypothetical protein